MHTAAGVAAAAGNCAVFTGFCVLYLRIGQSQVSARTGYFDDGTATVADNRPAVQVNRSLRTVVNDQSFIQIKIALKIIIERTILLNFQTPVFVNGVFVQYDRRKRCRRQQGQGHNKG